MCSTFTYKPKLSPTRFKKKKKSHTDRHAAQSDQVSMFVFLSVWKTDFICCGFWNERSAQIDACTEYHRSFKEKKKKKELEHSREVLHTSQCNTILMQSFNKAGFGFFRNTEALLTASNWFYQSFGQKTGKFCIWSIIALRDNQYVRYHHITINYEVDTCIYRTKLFISLMRTQKCSGSHIVLILSYVGWHSHPNHIQTTCKIIWLYY